MDVLSQVIYQNIALIGMIFIIGFLFILLLSIISKSKQILAINHVLEFDQGDLSEQQMKIKWIINHSIKNMWVGRPDVKHMAHIPRVSEWEN